MMTVMIKIALLILIHLFWREYVYYVLRKYSYILPNCLNIIIFAGHVETKSTVVIVKPKATFNLSFNMLSLLWYGFSESSVERHQSRSLRTFVSQWRSQLQKKRKKRKKGCYRETKRTCYIHRNLGKVDSYLCVCVCVYRVKEGHTDRQRYCKKCIHLCLELRIIKTNIFIKKILTTFPIFNVQNKDKQTEDPEL